MELVGRYGFHIMMSQVDDSGDCRLSALGNLLIHSACMHAEALGFGVDMLHQSNIAWVLTNLSVEAFKMPRYLDEVFVETWMEGRSHYIVSRNFIIYDKENNIIGGGASYWTVIDVQKRSVVDFTKMTLEACSHPEPSIIGKPKRKKPFHDIEVVKREVVYSDIDTNNHMYSLKYVEHALDAISMEEMRVANLKRFDISYLHEVVLGEAYRICRSNTEIAFTIFSHDGKPASVVSFN